ncbi:hypothetical protein V6N13_127518 [Hibiscus sabdariffa]
MVDDDKIQRLVSQEHSQWPPESFRLSPGLRASSVSLLPWMSETLLPSRLVSQNIRSGRLRAFAFARLESLCCFTPSLDV